MCIQLRMAFHDHFVPHQFGIATRAGVEALVHALWAALYLHLDTAVFHLDVAHAFNAVSCDAVFCKLELAGGPLAQLIPFVRCVYDGSLPLFYRDGWDD